MLDNIRVTYGSHFQFRHTSGAHNDANIGNNGVYIIGHHNLVKNSEIAYSAGNGLTMEGDYNTVENCLIHDFGYMGTVTSGVYFKGKTALEANEDPSVLMSKGSTLQHSTLFNSGRDVLEITSCWDCTFTYNHLHDSSLLTDDSGLVYADSRNLGNTEIAYNWVQGDTNPNRELSRFHLGIYLDNLTRNGIVHHNVITGIGVEPGVGMNTPREGDVYKRQVWMCLRASSREIRAFWRRARRRWATRPRRGQNNRPTSTANAAAPARARRGSMRVGTILVYLNNDLTTTIIASVAGVKSDECHVSKN